MVIGQTIKIWAVDFWPGFQLQDSFFYRLIELCGYIPIIDSINPDILFCSVFGNNHTQYTKPIKIWFSGENWGLPDFNQYQYGLSCYLINNPQHYRLPIYVLYADEYIKTNQYLKAYDQLVNPRNLAQIKPKTKFCNFIYSNCDIDRYEGIKFRQEFFRQLSQYKPIDSGGTCLNNVGHIVDKLSWISDYKFTIAMENSPDRNGVPGYTTEKILQPMLVDSIPIYWGNSLVSKDFNPKSIVSYHDYNDINKLIDRIIEIDNNDDLYNQYLSEPFVLNYASSPLNINKLITFFKTNIIK